MRLLGHLPAGSACTGLDAACDEISRPLRLPREARLPLLHLDEAASGARIYGAFVSARLGVYRDRPEEHAAEDGLEELQREGEWKKEVDQLLKDHCSTSSIDFCEAPSSIKVDDNDDPADRQPHLEAAHGREDLRRSLLVVPSTWARPAVRCLARLRASNP